MSSASSLRVYCTYFDSDYLSRGLALIESLRNNGDSSDIYVLALDSTTFRYFQTAMMPGVHVIDIHTLEENEPRLVPLKAQRSTMEYYFTCTPLLIKYAMAQFGVPGALSIYLDGDLFFFDNPDLVVKALGTDSVGIIEHKYPQHLEKKLAQYGRFNVGWVGFRDDYNGKVVLDWYSERTLEWCSDTPEDGKYADQGYLNSFPKFDGVKILTSPGFNLAPWNIQRHDITSSTKQANSAVFVDGEKLTFFHFHGLRKVGTRFVTGEFVYGSRINSVLKKCVYVPYVEKLITWDGLLKQQIGENITIKKRGAGFKGMISRLRKTVMNVISITVGNSVKPAKN